MDCRRVRRHLPEYTEGGLEKELQQKIDEHIKKCDGCAHELLEIKGLLDMAGRTARIKASADFEDKLRQRIAADSLSRERKSSTIGALVDIFRSGAWLKPAFAAALLAIVLLSVGLNSLSGKLEDTREEILTLNRKTSGTRVALDRKDREVAALRQIIKNEIYVPQRMEELYDKALFHKRFAEYDKMKELLHEIIVTCPYKNIAQKARKELMDIPKGKVSTS